MSWYESIKGTWLEKIMRGITKIAIATVVITLLNSANIDLSAVSLGGNTFDLSIIWDIIKVFGPVALVLSGLKDLGAAM